MNWLNLEMFIGAQRDYEHSQLQILGGIKKVRSDFSSNKIYPTLSELIELYQTLIRITHSSDEIKNEMPRRISGLDLETRRVLYEAESFDLNSAEIEAIEQLIHWSLPHIQFAIEEGKTIYNFVDEHLTLEGVGIVPSYIEEGYLLVPELKNNLLHVVRYEVSIFAGSGERFRNLKTSFVRTVALNAIGTTPGSLKLDLMRTNRDLPNPATYVFETDLDFPFAETILPIAKRKFLRKLYS